MKNTGGLPCGKGPAAPKSRFKYQDIKNKKRRPKVSPRLIIFVFDMYTQLTSGQRYTIFALLQKGFSKKEIALTIGVHYSTVYRETNRNSSPYTGQYRPVCAQRMAERRKRRFQKPRKLTPEVRATVIKYLKQDWSPQQITGRLRALGKETVSHETIYEMIRRDKAWGGKLYQHCRFQLKHINHWVRRKEGKLPDGRKSITERPVEADGKRFGDWEMDLIVGPKRSAVLTIIEKSTNLLIIRKLPQGYKSEQVSKAVIEALKPYKKNVMTITTDNGSEFAKYKEIEQKLGCQVYYAKPYAPWQKGAVENVNMLIRQYVPKGFNINNISTQYLTYIQNKINRRPREKLKFKSPIFVFNKKID